MSIPVPVYPNGFPKSQCDCFKAAAEYIQRQHLMDGPHDYRLVHGILTPPRQDRSANHAWVEEEDFVYEVSKRHKLLFSKDDYYKQNQITHIRKYTVEEVFKHIDKYGHSGPWD